MILFRQKRGERGSSHIDWVFSFLVFIIAMVTFVLLAHNFIIDSEIEASMDQNIDLLHNYIVMDLGSNDLETISALDYDMLKERWGINFDFRILITSLDYTKPLLEKGKLLDGGNVYAKQFTVDAQYKGEIKHVDVLIQTFGVVKE